MHPLQLKKWNILCIILIFLIINMIQCSDHWGAQTNVWKMKYSRDKKIHPPDQCYYLTITEKLIRIQIMACSHFSKSWHRQFIIFCDALEQWAIQNWINEWMNETVNLLAVTSNKPFHFILTYTLGINYIKHNGKNLWK